jgi:iron complex outermembrane recepter protein
MSMKPHLMSAFFNMSRSRRPAKITAALVFWTVMFLPLGALRASDSLTYLKSLKIEDLLQTEVTSVSKKSEKLSDATAAVFVITAEDIRRSGARTIAEALRMAPGLQVCQFDANKWAVSARGFNDTFSNKLLVLIDGRSVYTPLFSGVFWDVQDTMIEDIDRIEVIRGPGATLWGANAVNGVINIITKSAQQTQGSLVTLGTGSHEAYDAAVRYGNQLGSDGAWRIYAKGFDRGPFKDAAGREANDQWDALRSGFRMDMDLNARDSVTLQGDMYTGNEDLTLDLPGTLSAPPAGPQGYSGSFSGANFLGRWRRTNSDTSDFAVQLYYDRTQRDQFVLGEDRDTLDFDFQHRFQLTLNQALIWGLGYRYTRDDIQNSERVSMIPDSRADQLLSAFVQDEITLQPDKWWLTMGSKFEHNDYTGFEVQPSLRLRWKPESQQTAWAAVSRAVRTPSRSDYDLRSNRTPETTALPFPPYSATYQPAIFGDDDFESEELIAYELGYRWQPAPRISTDVAAFYNQYHKLRTLEPDPAASYFEADPEPHTVVPAFFGNKMKGETYGIEWVATWQPLNFWKLTAGYTWLQMDLHAEADSGDTSAEEQSGISPVHQIQLRSNLDLPRGWSFDSALYYVDELSALDVPAYTRLDLRIGWQPDPVWEFSLSLQNLLDDRHPEFAERTDAVPSEIPRQIYAQITWRH